MAKDNFLDFFCQKAMRIEHNSKQKIQKRACYYLVTMFSHFQRRLNSWFNLIDLTAVVTKQYF